ncbi:MAG: Cell pole-organizing protein PopZ [Candidatus Midichloria mitochondrii]|nr:DUF2497 domain-containing protein [Candidatus Midichloria mitochondrii]MDJ1255910.1 DUF2497 domain-containing protein [Candidatus Midichloria mitochondrii]MDJ1287649.1 DUF2497 domain-containing protein [Candidatus Midichloria mitochondrii]MDJ1298472.1 DUF2497 domain-containing protein [Candidatus Midichloria mitochondrii]MDJ1312531.1 DUF2497 domain-containing protein [Candidatus Midichloria mitochondrii]MDJ1583142.1 DUF2497 domain-containing protein [Candidatus Midichloria mitochondrii]
MSKSGDMYDALSDIKNLMQQNSALTSMKNDILELTNLVEEGTDQKDTPNKKVKGALDKFQVTEGQLTSTLQEILKPYLKTWLDDNLPSIVKEVVERQIKMIMDESNKK